jgi:hypothetical protein
VVSAGGSEAGKDRRNAVTLDEDDFEGARGERLTDLLNRDGLTEPFELVRVSRSLHDVFRTAAPIGNENYCD